MTFLTPLFFMSLPLSSSPQAALNHLGLAGVDEDEVEEEEDEDAPLLWMTRRYLTTSGWYTRSMRATRALLKRACSSRRRTCFSAVMTNFRRPSSSSFFSSAAPSLSGFLSGACPSWMRAAMRSPRCLVRKRAPSCLCSRKDVRDVVVCTRREYF